MTLDQQEVIDALPNYEVGAELGRGGWGVVLAGRHRQLGREVAIKQLPRAFAADESVRARFVTEARLLASLDHPHIVPVYDFVERDGLCLLVMEQLPSGTLWSRFSTDGFTQPAAAAAVLAAIAGLQAAHEHQILHRDVKPENLMFSATGALKVTDFGIAKVVGGDGTLATRAGEVVGTPAYIAPEQARGGELSPATDVYAVATMFYELLSGQLPFADDADAMALLFKHAFETPTPLRDRAPFVPEGIAEVVMRGSGHRPGRPVRHRRGVRRRHRRGVHERVGSRLAGGRGHAGDGGQLDRVGDRPDHLAAAPAHRVRRPAGAGDVPAPPTVGDAAAPSAAHRWRRRRARAPAPPTVAAPTAPVHPAGAAHEVGVQLQDVQESDLVPVQSVLIPPAKATVPLLLAVLGLILVVVIAAFGIGSPDHSGDLHAGTVTVAGIDPTSGHVVTLDLSKNVPVGVTAAAPGADPGPTHRRERRPAHLAGFRAIAGRARNAQPSGRWHRLDRRLVRPVPGRWPSRGRDRADAGRGRGRTPAVPGEDEGDRPADRGARRRSCCCCSPWPTASRSPVRCAGAAGPGPPPSGWG